jgi:hypothetical protein
LEARSAARIAGYLGKEENNTDVSMFDEDSFREHEVANTSSDYNNTGEALLHVRSDV